MASHTRCTLTPLAMGASMLFQRSLKDLPCPSYILSGHICCSSWKVLAISFTLVDFRGRHVVLLSVVSSTRSASRTHINTVIVLPVEDRPEVAVFVRHSVLICPRHVGVTCCCSRPTFEVKNGGKIL
jgi:hypothetical protein